MLDSDTLDNPKESTTKATPIMGGVHLGKAKECALVLPIVWRDFFIPVSCYGEIRILVLGLPCIAGEGHKARLFCLYLR